MSNIQLHAMSAATGRSLPPHRNLLLIYPLKIRNGLNSMKTNDKKFLIYPSPGLMRSGTALWTSSLQRPASSLQSLIATVHY